MSTKWAISDRIEHRALYRERSTKWAISGRIEHRALYRERSAKWAISGIQPKLMCQYLPWLVIKMWFPKCAILGTKTYLLSRPSFTSRTRNKDQKTEQLFYFQLVPNPETFMSSTVIAFVHAVCKHSQKCLAQKVVRFGSLGWMTMIQVPFYSSCVTLQYETLYHTGRQMTVWAGIRTIEHRRIVYPLGSIKILIKVTTMLM